MTKKHILLIEDDPDLRDLIEYNLHRDGYRVTVVETGEEGLRIAGREVPDLIVLDIMLPGIDGLEVCKRLKGDRHTGSIQIIMLTARTEEADIVAGLEIGADDYITKPFSPRVLIARIRARLRLDKQTDPSDQEVIERDGVLIDPRRHVVKVKGNQVNLTPTEFRILTLLARNAGLVFSRYEIVDGVQGGDAVVTDRSVDVQIVGLRKKLGSCSSLIETVRGFGYRFKE